MALISVIPPEMGHHFSPPFSSMTPRIPLSSYHDTMHSTGQEKHDDCSFLSVFIPNILSGSWEESIGCVCRHTETTVLRT